MLKLQTGDARGERLHGMITGHAPHPPAPAPAPPPPPRRPQPEIAEPEVDRPRRYTL
jgi:hypothetical protein